MWQFTGSAVCENLHHALGNVPQCVKKSKISTCRQKTPAPYKDVKGESEKPHEFTTTNRYMNRIIVRVDHLSCCHYICTKKQKSCSCCSHVLVMLCLFVSSRILPSSFIKSNTMAQQSDDIYWASPHINSLSNLWMRHVALIIWDFLLELIMSLSRCFTVYLSLGLQWECFLHVWHNFSKSQTRLNEIRGINSFNV